LKFGELIKHAKPELVVSQRHDKWMRENGNPKYSGAAIQFAVEQLGAVQRERKGTVSASSLNTCRRRQIFTYLGWYQLPPAGKTAAIFHNGTMMHIRWQMAGLTEGWLAQAEVPVGQNHLNLSGTQDGIAYDGTIVEFKSINSNGFRQVNTFGPKDDHKMQVGTYGACTGNDKATIIYECKDTQEYREFVVPIDSELISQVNWVTEKVWDYIETKELPEPLPVCEEKSGYRYNGCPYRDRCLKTRDYEHAMEQA
jgi:hypothetical protein